MILVTYNTQSTLNDMSSYINRSAESTVGY